MVPIGDRTHGRADLSEASKVVIGVRQAPVGPNGHGRDAVVRIVRVVQGGLVIATHRGQATEAVVGIRHVAERVLQGGALPKAVHGRRSACPIRLCSGHTLEPTLGVELSLPGGGPPLGVNNPCELSLRIVGELPLQTAADGVWARPWPVALDNTMAATLRSRIMLCIAILPLLRCCRCRARL